MQIPPPHAEIAGKVVVCTRVATGAGCLSNAVQSNFATKLFLVPASAAVPAANKQQNEHQNNDEKRSRIHVYLRVLKIPQKAISALHLKADICSAPAHVCFGPRADIIGRLSQIMRRVQRARQFRREASRNRLVW